LVDEVDGLQRPDHDLEFDNLARVVPLDQVNPVDQHAVDLGLELQHGVGCADDLPHIAKALIEEHLESRAQIPGNELPATLWGMDDR
jgi:hypothetical protein